MNDLYLYTRRYQTHLGPVIAVSFIVTNLKVILNHFIQIYDLERRQFICSNINLNILGD